MTAATPDALAKAVREITQAMNRTAIDLAVGTSRLSFILVDVTSPLKQAREALREYRTAVETGQIPAGPNRDQIEELLQACIKLQEYLRNLELAIELVTDDDTPKDERRRIKIAWIDMQAEVATGLLVVLGRAPAPRQLRPVPSS